MEKRPRCCRGRSATKERSENRFVEKAAAGTTWIRSVRDPRPRKVARYSESFLGLMPVPFVASCEGPAILTPPLAACIFTMVYTSAITSVRLYPLLQLKSMSPLDTFPISDPEVLIAFLTAQYPNAAFATNGEINLVFARNIIFLFQYFAAGTYSAVVVSARRLASCLEPARNGFRSRRRRGCICYLLLVEVHFPSNGGLCCDGKKIPLPDGARGADAVERSVGQ